ncbi:MAG: ATP-dependent DNA helicase RecG [Fusicatenibacter sp.]|nr:ATP-dependent DNA helicase RecG [Fusicatenibacter sp.]
MNTEPLTSLKGIGEKTEKLFAKVGVHNLQQLLHYYPRDYDSYESPVPLRECKIDEKNAVIGRVHHSPSVKANQKNSVILLELYEQPLRLQLIWFHMPFLRSMLKKGSVFVFRGKVQERNGRLVMEQPEIFTPAAYEALQSTMQPIYGLTKGLTSKMVAKAVAQVQENCAPARDYLPEEIRSEQNLCDINYALTQIHFPKDRDSLLTARRRLAFEEFFLFLLALRQLKEHTEDTVNAFPIQAVWKTEEVIENLPYQLTGAQMRVWNEIESDMKGHTRMSRLIQGDVGSGKTILAFLAMILSAQNGYQSAMMVPTEVLAHQHYEALCRLLEENHLSEYQPMLLTGSTKASEKKKIYEQLSNGNCRMIIGTHALIQEKVQYHRLALVITDEQHRFGVRQRTALASKGDPPNVLVMSATPIPRTLAIILYGDLDISVIDELPKNRLPVKNCVVDVSYRPKTYRFIEKQASLGRQIYVICPMVEESEGLDAENVTDYTRKLKEELSPGISVAMLHGQMKPAMKKEIMERFASGEIQVLVSTTVIEVGVNVPNATVMMIENAERFGLAQLHQLRGRVGRGTEQSYCIFIQGNKDKEVAKRLEILKNSNDGFLIASEDLKLRGSGDLLGTRQSGEMEFAIADIYRDADLLKSASEAVSKLLFMDPELEKEEHYELKRVFADYLNLENFEIGL